MIQCTTGVSQRAVSSAYKLVVVMANALLRWNTDMAESGNSFLYFLLQFYRCIVDINLTLSCSLFCITIFMVIADYHYLNAQ